MSRNRWSRYVPPSEPRNEDGEQPPSTSDPDPPKSRRATTRLATTQGGKGSKPVWIAVAVTTGVVVVPITAALIGNAADDDPLPPADTTLLDEQFVRESLEAVAEVVGEQVVGVRLSEYSLAVEDFEPAKNKLITYQFNNYSDGYSVDPEENYYPDYRPRPFQLEDFDPAALVSVTEDALGRTDDPFYFFVTASADEDTGEVEVVATVSGEGGDDVTVRATGSGEIVTVE